MRTRDSACVSRSRSFLPRRLHETMHELL